MNQKTLNLFPFKISLSFFFFFTLLVLMLTSCGVMRRSGEGCPSTNIPVAKSSYRGR
ncbi:MAG: hypothetical protein JWP88_2224 [Flaviaesturariibacter sp.]|nr:hypothetical protein [Flaviaesturariibacter sp.]